MLYLERQQAREVEAAAALREVRDRRGRRLDVLLGVQLAVEDHQHGAVLVHHISLAAAQHEEVLRDAYLVADLVVDVDVKLLHVLVREAVLDALVVADADDRDAAELVRCSVEALGLLRAARRLVRAVKVEDRGLARYADLRQSSRRELLPHSHTHAQRRAAGAHRASRRAESSTAAERKAEKHLL